jgi:hypothetical protein
MKGTRLFWQSILVVAFAAVGTLFAAQTGDALKPQGDFKFGGTTRPITPEHRVRAMLDGYWTRTLESLKTRLDPENISNDDEPE